MAYRGMMAGIRETPDDAQRWIDRALALLDAGTDARLEALVLGDVGTVDYLHRNDPARLLRAVRLADEVGLHVGVVRG